MNLKDLKKEIPFKWRTQSTSEWGSNCVAYIDARQAQDILDEVCGQDGWQCEYKEYKGNLFCSIGIFTEFEQWVWKSDCGSESNIEKQKGEASDAFKRAAVMWGVGRFLYSMKIVKIKEVKQDKNKKWYPVDKKGNKIWDITEHCNSLLGKKEPEVKKEPVKESAIKECEKILRKCTTLKELQEVYMVMDASNKKALEGVKNELKAKLK